MISFEGRRVLREEGEGGKIDPVCFVARLVEIWNRLWTAGCGAARLCARNGAATPIGGKGRKSGHPHAQTQHGETTARL